MKILAKADIDKLLAHWTGQGARIYAPIRTKAGDLLFGALTDGALDLGEGLPIDSPKTVLFPQVEPIRKGIDEAAEANGDIVLLGVRPCDVSALKTLDQTLGLESPDDGYQRRRENLLVVANG